jgi:uncharacterized protein YbjQ (UPF0145 family)
MRCSRCGNEFGGFFGVLTADLTRPNLCPECEREKREVGREEQRRRQEIAKRAEKILLTTTPSIDGHQIVAYLGIESVEIVIGTGFLSELSGEISAFLGQRSTKFEAKLAEAKQVAFDLLKTRAAEKGSNAVVGIDLDYTEFSGNRVALIVNGTLVRAAPIAKPDQ